MTETRATPAVASIAPLKMYEELAPWWPLLSAPEEYAEEAEFFLEKLRAASTSSLRTLLELGSGGGNNASHMKEHFDQVTLVDLSPGMLEVSEKLNPDCEHHQGDMRSVRLDKQFDCVFVHDAVCYMTTEEDLRRAFETAFVHCKPGGVALFAPDHVRENFRESTDDGGHDGAHRGMRYLCWVWDPDPSDTTYVADYAYLLRDTDGSVRVVHDRHVEGLFGRDDWLRLLEEAGFVEPSVIPLVHSEVEPGMHEHYVVKRPPKEDRSENGKQ